MKKTLLIGLFLLLFLLPVLVGAANPTPGPLVQCGTGTPKYNANGDCIANCPCTITDFFAMIGRIYNFIVWNIAAPLAILGLTIGGIFILISAGNPNLAGRGKQIVWASIIGLFLVFASWVIINTILATLGYKGVWNAL